PELRDLVGERLGMDLNGRPPMLTIRGRTGKKDGQIHADSKSKLVTVLLYLNSAWSAPAGRLRLLYNDHDLSRYAAEPSPDAARPGLAFDWVIDENLQEIAGWHPAVKGVITTNHREWRGALASSETHGSISKTIEQIRSNEYDLVIDGQGNFKTALLSLFAK